MSIVRSLMVLGVERPIAYSKRPPPKGGWWASIELPVGAHPTVTTTRIYRGGGECKACAFKKLRKKVQGLTF